MRENWSTVLLYESPNPGAALREQVRLQPAYLVSRVRVEPKSAKCGPDGGSAISTATSTDGVARDAWAGDVRLSPAAAVARALGRVAFEYGKGGRVDLGEWTIFACP